MGSPTARSRGCPVAAVACGPRAASRHRRADLGTIESGKLSDLVLLKADPLDDIANTTRISAFVADGILYDESVIETLLTDVLASSRRLM